MMLFYGIGGKRPDVSPDSKRSPPWSPASPEAQVTSALPALGFGDD